MSEVLELYNYVLPNFKPNFNFELGKNERYYPIPKDENRALYNKYLEKAKTLKNTYFLGRLGDYQYYDMDKAILRAIELFEEVFSA